MYTTYVITFISVFAGLSVGITGVALVWYLKQKTNTKWFLIHLAYAVVALSNTAAVLWHGSFYRFSFLHFTYMGFFAFTGIVLVRYIRTKRQTQVASIVFSVIFAAFIGIRFTYPIPLYHKLPLNICNIATLLIIVRPLFRSKMTDSYMLFFTVFGIVMNVFLGEFYRTDTNGFMFFETEGFVSNTLHFTFIPYVLFILCKRDITMARKSAMLNALWILPYFVLLIFLNQIYEYNYFFTSVHRNPILFLYKPFPVFQSEIGGRMFEFNILYYVILFVVTHIGLFCIAWLFEHLHIRRMRKTQDDRLHNERL